MPRTHRERRLSRRELSEGEPAPELGELDVPFADAPHVGPPSSLPIDLEAYELGCKLELEPTPENARAVVDYFASKGFAPVAIVAGLDKFGPILGLVYDAAVAAVNEAAAASEAEPP